MINADKEEEKEKEGESESERHGGWGTPCVEMEIGRGGKRASASSTRGLCVCVFCLKTVRIHLGGVWCSVQFDLSFQKRHRPRAKKKEPPWGVKSAYGRVTPPVGSFNPINRNISRFRKI